MLCCAALWRAGIVVGLATWGWRIMRVLGVKVTAITPARGAFNTLAGPVHP
jgi:phosphate/sulfate permease